MLTLTGAGGVGKTRLAIELARGASERWRDGVWWIDLAPIDDPALVPGAIAQSLQLPGSGPASDKFTTWIADKQALLVFDNCEHVVAACADLFQESLERHPEIAILATSREALGVPGEVRWSVAPMSDSDAALLFELRGRSVQPRLQSKQDRDVITRICHRLDNLPLAVEMAAARLDLMSPSELLANLGHRFELLASTTRSASARQQTLLATIDWSYRLLLEAESRLFRRLSVFRGGFTIDSAQAVAGDDGSPVIDLIGNLVRKSMVEVDRPELAGTRYRLLESLRTYGEQALRASGEEQLIRQKHYDFYRGALSPTPGLRAGPVDPVAREAWKRLEFDNMQSALSWARDNAEDMGLELGALVAFFAFADVPRMQRVLIDLLERSPATGNVRVMALNHASWNELNMGNYDAALSLAEQALALARTVGLLDALVSSLNRVGHVHQERGELDAADELFQEAAMLLEGSSNLHSVQLVNNSIGMLSIMRGDYPRAQAVLTSCVAYARAHDTYWLPSYLESLARAQFGLRDFAAATSSWQDSLVESRDRESHLDILLAMAGLCRTAEAGRDDLRAVRLGAATHRMSTEWSLKVDPWPESLDDVWNRAKIRLARGADRAWSEGESMTYDDAIDYALGSDHHQNSSDSVPLTRRERQVAILVAEGLKNREVAKRLFLSNRTVEGHVDRIRAKLGLRSRTELALWAADRGLVSGRVPKD